MKDVTGDRQYRLSPGAQEVFDEFLRDTRQEVIMRAAESNVSGYQSPEISTYDMLTAVAEMGTPRVAPATPRSTESRRRSLRSSRLAREYALLGAALIFLAAASYTLYLILIRKSPMEAAILSIGLSGALLSFVSLFIPRSHRSSSRRSVGAQEEFSAEYAAGRFIVEFGRLEAILASRLVSCGVIENARTSVTRMIGLAREADLISTVEYEELLQLTVMRNRVAHGTDDRSTADDYVDAARRIRDLSAAIAAVDNRE